MAGWHPNTLHVKSSHRTFDLQDSLPALPVPDLTHTLTNYLNSCKPLLSSAEYQTTAELVKSFQQGVGSILQEYLLQQARKCEGQKTSWLEKWWDLYAYHSNRSPLVNNVNFFGTLYGGCPSRSPILRAATFIRGMLLFKLRLDDQKIPPEALGKQGALPLCMHQFTRVFGATRIPGTPADEILLHPSSTHVVIWMNSVFFSIQVLSEKGDALTDVQIMQQLLHIAQLEKGLTTEERVPIAALTGLRRDQWAKERAELLDSNMDNAENINVLESALFHLSFSNEAPETMEEMMRLACQGPEKNIWFDKSCSFIVFRNGKTAFNGEHSCTDAPVPARINTDAVNFSMHLHGYRKLNNGNLEEEDLCEELMLRTNQLDRLNIPEPKILRWKLTTKLKKSIQAACTSVDAENKLHKLKLLRYNNYGNRFIKKYARASPDSYIQVILQLAYYRDQQSITSTYESATMRTFLHGRTDTVLSLTSEVVEFVKIMDDPSSCNAMKLKAFKKAVKVHQQLAQQTLIGKGISRHLMGLRIAAQELGLEDPEMFQHSSFIKHNTYDLSTSQMVTEQGNFPGFGAPNRNGLWCLLCLLRSTILALYNNITSKEPQKGLQQIRKRNQESIG